MKHSVQTLAVGPFETNCYLLHAGGSEVIVIDPAAEAEVIADFLEKHKWVPSIYLCTHGHMDHITALAALCSRWPAPVAMHPADLAWAFSEVNEMPPYFSAPDRPAGTPSLLKDGQECTTAGLMYSVIETPGHTPGSVCLLFPELKILFSGDTLFAGSVGRTDLQGGDPRKMQAAIKKLSMLDPGIQVYPGHGPATDIATEKKTNFFMQRL